MAAPSSARLQRLTAHLENAAAAGEEAGKDAEKEAGNGGKVPHTFGIADAQALKTIGAVALSPCERWVAYTVSEKDLEADKSGSSLWLVAAGGGEAVRMSAPGLGASAPAFSADGALLSFVASRPIPPGVSGLDEEISTAQVCLTRHLIAPSPIYLSSRSRHHLIVNSPSPDHQFIIT